MKVLIAEDDLLTRRGLADILQDEGYTVLLAANGEEALALFQSDAPDFVCLDIMMPKTDGYAVCKAIRHQNAKVPIIFISAKSEEIDKVLGLDLGADDFIVKPFGVKEVVARIRAVTRRYMAAQQPDNRPETFWMQDVEIIPAELRARKNDAVFDLSLRDVSILTFLHDNPGKALHRNTIFDHCWGEDFFPSSRTLDQHISQLRKRIETDPKNPAIIKTVHGVGYRYDG